MKNKTAKKAITAILVCFAVCMSAIAAITFGAQTPVTASAAETSTVSGYNLYDFSLSKWPNGSYKDYLATNIDDGADFGRERIYTVQCTQSFPDNQNFILWNDIYWQSGLTYNISFWVITSENMSSNFYVSARYRINGSAKMINELSVKGTKAEFTQYTATVTADNTSVYGTNNCFEFIFGGLEKDQVVMLGDVEIVYPKSAESAKNLFNKNIKYGNPAHASKITREDTVDTEHGNIHTFTATEALTSVVIRTDFVWQKDTPYHISFWYKAAVGNGTASSYALIRATGKANTPITAQTAIVPFNVSSSVSQWRMFNYVFTMTDSFPADDATRKDTVFDLMIEKIGVDDTVTITDFRIVKVCDHSEGEKEATYTWSKDYSTCTAEYGICKSCDSPTANYVTETVTAVKSETAATFTTAGETVYTAAFENSAFTEQTKTIAIAVKQAAVKTYDGVSFRIIAPYGLRWSSGVDKNDYNALVEEFGAENVTVGTIITAYDLLGETDFTIEAMSAANIQYKNIVNDTWHTALTNEQNDGNFCYYASLVNIQDYNLNREFAGRAYVKAEKDGKTYYYYAAFAKENNVRTYTNLCKALVKENKESEAATNFAKGVIDKTVDITLTENTAEIVTVDNYVSPYTVAYVDGKLTLTAKDGGNVTNVKFIYVDGEKKAFTQNGNALEVTL